MPESFAALAAMYVEEMNVLADLYGEEEAVSRFRQNHQDIEVPLALLARVGISPPWTT